MRNNMATKIYIFCAILLLVLPHTTQSKPNDSPFGFLKSLEGCKKGQNVDGLHRLKRYLGKFGYLENHTMTINNENDQLFDERLEEAIKTYQHNYGLNVTGHLDATTVQQMIKPRCGVPDIIDGKNTMRRKDKASLYTNQGLAWPSSEYKLTFQIQSGTLVPGVENMRSVVIDQLSKWEQDSPFTFEEVGEGNQSDLVFGFAVGNHGDRYPFDGPGGVVGHSFYPTGGVSHYDATEDWSDNPGVNQVDLNTVVLHEIGHLLGLSHTQDQSAVMFAIIDRGVKKRELQQDDVLGIQAIYGKV